MIIIEINIDIVNKYYNSDITLSKIKENYNINKDDFYDYCHSMGLENRKKLYKMFNTNEELARLLLSKYSSMKSRTRNKDGGRSHYGKQILNRLDYVKFCNDNMKTIENIYNKYENTGELKDRLSIDRINDDKGYIYNNMQFTSYGFNSFKASIKRPVKIYDKNNNEYRYFMSLQEASVHYNKPKKHFSHLFHDYKKESDEYILSITNIEEVLIKNNYENLLEYYNKRGD